jgi:hypothetical protein
MRGVGDMMHCCRERSTLRRNHFGQAIGAVPVAQETSAVNIGIAVFRNFRDNDVWYASTRRRPRTVAVGTRAGLPQAGLPQSQFHNSVI